MLKRLALLLASLFFCSLGEAYPWTIGLGYTTCVTCHYNSHGNGPLNDYGRALFSSEIAARNFWTSKDISDDQIAESSGFIPWAELPTWLRPSAKYRGLWVQTNPGSTNWREQKIDMQRDYGLTLLFGQDGQTLLTYNYGLLPREGDPYNSTGNQVTWINREFYLRTFLTEKLLIAIGLMDRVYGLRTSDHTAFSRSRLGFGQNDQVDGVLLHYMSETWEGALHFSLGNTRQQVQDRKVGLSSLWEFDVGEKNRAGFSFASAKNETVQENRAAYHHRWALRSLKKSTLIAEFGLKQDRTAFDGKTKTGTYGLIEGLFHIHRGYNFFSTIERLQEEGKYTSPEQQRWSFGFLIFPLQRTELRLSAVQAKTFSPESADFDIWQLQGQAHVSW